jgi:hypothetical protein
VATHVSITSHGVGVGVGVGMTALSIKVSSYRVVLVVNVTRGGVDTDLDPSKESIGDVPDQVDVLQEWVIVSTGLHNAPHVLVVAGTVWVLVLYGLVASTAERMSSPQKSWPT